MNLPGDYKPKINEMTRWSAVDLISGSGRSLRLQYFYEAPSTCYSYCTIKWLIAQINYTCKIPVTL